MCFLVVVLSIADIRGQATGDPRQDFLYGEYYIGQAKYQDALPFYLSVLNDSPDNSNVNYRIGQCYMHILGEQMKALPYLQKAVKEIDPKYVEGRYKQTAAPPEAWLLLGDAYHRDNQLRNASFAYYQYKDLIGDSDKDRLEMINKKIEGLGISYEFQRSEHTYGLFNMGNVINTRFSDYNPVMNADQNTLIYTQYWESYDRIVISYRKNGAWTTPVELNNQIGSEGDCYTSSLSADGKELFLVRYGDIGYDIYETQFVDSTWQKMKPVNGKVNTRHRESSACISGDGKTLYFSSDRPGGYGGFDLYKATWEDGSWEGITNLGKIINTKGNEEAPFLTADGRVLYFSSNGHETIGNMDILYSDLGDDGEWEEPVNIGLPVNTTGDDVFFIFFEDTHTGYLSRDLPEGYGKNDIYELKISNDSIIPNKSLTSPGSKQNRNSEALETEYIQPSADSVEFAIRDSSGIGMASESYAEKGSSGQTVPGDNIMSTSSTGVTEGKPNVNNAPGMTGNSGSANSEKQRTGEEPSGTATGKGPATSTISASQAKNDISGNTGINTGADRSGTSSENAPVADTRQPENDENNQRRTSSKPADQKTTTKNAGTRRRNSTTGVTSDSGQKSPGITNPDSGSAEQGTSGRNAAGRKKQEKTDNQNSSESAFSGVTDTEAGDENSGLAGQTAQKNSEGGVSDTHAESNTRVNPEKESKTRGKNKENGTGSENGTKIKPVPESKSASSEETATFPDDASSNEFVQNNKSENKQGAGQKASSNEEKVKVGNTTAADERNKQEEESKYYAAEEISAISSSAELPVYTIQVIALKHPVKASFFKLAPLKISAGNDGLYRYTYGEYHGWSVASSHLDSIKEAGFPDAFVRNITTIQNYSSGLSDHEK